MQHFEEIISQHERIGLQVSGGRDSIACLYLLRPYWDKLIVYWLDSGSAFPETVTLMQKIRDMVPNFARIDGLQPAVVEAFGMPSDIVPVSATPIGIEVAGKGERIQDRYMCCFRSIMLPMQERMIADGVTLVIRGQKDADKFKATIKSGEWENGIQYLFPIQDWTTKQVMDYLREQQAPIPRFYEMLDTAPDCMSCTAWWEDGAAKYLKRYHHTQYVENQKKLDVINQAVAQHIAAFNKEVTA